MFIAVVLVTGSLLGIICTISACGNNTNAGYQTETANTPYAEPAKQCCIQG